MTKERYMTLSAAVLKDLAKARGIKGSYAMKKDELIEAMLAKDAAEEAAAAKAERKEDAAAKAERAEESAAPETAAEPETAARKAPHRKKTAETAAVAENGTYTAERKTDEPQHTEKKAGRGRRPGHAGEKAETAGRRNARGAEKPERGRKKAEAASADNAPAEKPAASPEMTAETPASASEQPAKTPAAAPEQTAEKAIAAPEQPAETPVAAPEQTAEKAIADPEQPAEKPAGAPVRKTKTVRVIKRIKGDGQRPAEAEDVRDMDARESRDGRENRENREFREMRENREVREMRENREVRETREVREEAAPAQAAVETADDQKGPVREGEKVRGILEVMQDGFGFIRSANFLPGENDIYVSPSQIRRFNLKTGDMVSGTTRQKAQGEKFGALLYVESVNDYPADEARNRLVFEHMTPVFPYERIRLERPGGSTSSRIVDLICPIGKGQRGMIVSPPKAGKTTLLKDIAKSILYKDPDANLIILLIDERPEEVTDMKESVHGRNVEIIYSTFDELPEHHKRVSEMVIERAKRLVEHRQDVVILLDSITRLARAYNVLVPQSGRTLSGGLDPTALYMPKRFFGAARKMREGGSLTILATALVDTGSKMDDVVYEEFKGTGNMELILDRKLQERRIFPAIDIAKSGTRREDLLLSPEELEAVNLMRRSLNGVRADEATDAILNTFARLKSNSLVVQAILQRKLF